jgi:aldose 1-epimerase
MDAGGAEVERMESDGTFWLDDGHSRVEVHPELGAGIGHYMVLAAGGYQPIFHSDPARRGVFRLGCNVLLPFSNRISGGGFRHEGRFHPLTPNLEGNPFPTHGNAFTAMWSLVDRTATSAALKLASDGPGPFRYRAILRYALEIGALRCGLEVVNTADISLPYGAGFHPWFVRTADTHLQFGAGGHWSEKPDHLPDRFHPSGSVPELDFTRARELPAGWVNSGYTGWQGEARIGWPDRQLLAIVTAPPPLTAAILYSPSSAADFFCFEPVSHSVDTHNHQPPHSAAPQVLQPGETLSVEMTVAVSIM